jgi:hypothetical protein
MKDVDLAKTQGLNLRMLNDVSAHSTTRFRQKRVEAAGGTRHTARGARQTAPAAMESQPLPDVQEQVRFLGGPPASVIRYPPSAEQNISSSGQPEGSGRKDPDAS